MKRLQIVVLIGVVVLLAPIFACGQVVNGTIAGTIADTSGAVVPEAQVTVTNVGTGVSRSLKTNSSGYYSMPNLPPGTYKVSAQKPGFATGVHAGISLFAAGTVQINVTLQPGSVTQTVTVNAGVTPLLQTETAQTGRTVDTAMVEQLPLTTGRNFQNLLNLIPGAGVAVRYHSLAFNPQNSMSSTVNGNSSLANIFNIEGINDNERSTLLQMYIPAAEAIQEVSITASNYDPAQGTALGAVTNVILKSGTNAFHGEAYEFYQSNSLNARGFFSLGADGKAFHVPHLVDNYYGGNIGGPIQKGKTFFFVDYLERATREGESLQLSVPTIAMRSGDFSDPALTPIFDPATGDSSDCLGLSGGNSKLCGTGRQQFKNNVIPQGRLDPVAVKILSHVAFPNTNQSAVGASKYVNNLVTSSEFIQNTPDIDLKVDRYQGKKDHISGRFSYTKPSLDQPGLYGPYGGPISGGGISGLEGTGSQKTYSAGINWVHILSPTLLSEARVGLSRWYNIAHGTGYGQNLSSEVGIPGANTSQYTSGIVNLSGEGFSDPFVGTEGNLPWTRAGDNIELVNVWTKMAGNHSLEWGLEYYRIRDDLQLVSGSSGGGGFVFGAGTTALNGGPAAGFANNFAGFLLGVPSSLNRGVPNIFPAYRQNQIFPFLGDRWQVNPKLTLNLGVRWEYYGPPTPHFAGGFSNYNPTNNTLELAGLGNIPRDLGMEAVYHNFSPRVGLAYRLGNKSVVRAGFGTSYMTFPIDLYAYNYPLEPQVTYSSVSSFGPALLSPGVASTFELGFPAGAPYVLPSSGVIPINTPFLNSQAETYVNTHWKNPYLMSWNLAYQRDLPGNWVLDLAYVGNRGVDSPILYNLNAATAYGLGAQGQPEYKLFGRTASTSEYFAGYSSSYNSLQVKFDHQISKNFAMTTSYTYGKAIGYVSEAGDYPNGLQDYVNQRRNWASTDFNQTHILNESIMWHVPFGAGQRFVTSGIGSKLLGGWEIAGIWEFTTGFPLNFTCTCAGFNTPGNTASPNISGPVTKLYGIGPASPWFNTSVFSTPAAGTQGNTGYYISAGPNIVDLDASLFRRIKLTERFNLEFRSEWFHATNTPQFSNPGTELGTSNFGRVTSAAGARNIDFAAKLTF